MAIVNKKNAFNVRLLPGFRFQPSEEELVGYFLSAKIKDQTCHNAYIPSVDICGKDPFSLKGLSLLCDPNEAYIYSKIPISFSTSNGQWVKKSVSPILKENGTISSLPAIKTTYAFENQRRKNNWVMEELKFKRKNPTEKASDFAIFHIFMKKKSRTSLDPRPCRLAPNVKLSFFAPSPAPAESSSSCGSSATSKKKRRSPLLLDFSSSSLLDSSIACRARKIHRVVE